MDLDSSNLLSNDKSNLVKNFINELTEKLNSLENTDLTSIKDIEEEYKLNSDSISSLTNEVKSLLEEYSKNLNDDEKLYYVSYQNTMSNTYQVLEYDNSGKSVSSYISADELPENITVGYILKNENSEFAIDEELTKKFVNEIEKIAENLADEQNSELDNYREEGETYQVVDFSSHGLYLQNTENGSVFEEINLSEELLDKIGNGYVLKYENGEYIIQEDLTANSLA